VFGIAEKLLWTPHEVARPETEKPTARGGKGDCGRLTIAWAREADITTVL